MVIMGTKHKVDMSKRLHIDHSLTSRFKTQLSNTLAVKKTNVWMNMYIIK